MSRGEPLETACGLLNSIGLDNDGIEAFIEHHLPYLNGLDTAIIVSIAGKTHDEFVEMAVRLDAAAPSRDQTWSRSAASGPSTAMHREQVCSQQEYCRH